MTQHVDTDLDFSGNAIYATWLTSIAKCYTLLRPMLKKREGHYEMLRELLLTQLSQMQPANKPK